MHGTTNPPTPVNEPVLSYAPGSPEREALATEINRLERRAKTLRAYVGGRWRNPRGAEFDVVQPHESVVPYQAMPFRANVGGMQIIGREMQRPGR